MTSSADQPQAGRSSAIPQAAVPLQSSPEFFVSCYADMLRFDRKLADAGELDRRIFVDGMDQAHMALTGMVGHMKAKRTFSEGPVPLWRLVPRTAEGAHLAQNRYFAGGEVVGELNATRHRNFVVNTPEMKVVVADHQTPRNTAEVLYDIEGYDIDPLLLIIRAMPPVDVAAILRRSGQTIDWPRWNNEHSGWMMHAHALKPQGRAILLASLTRQLLIPSQLEQLPARETISLQPVAEISRKPFAQFAPFAEASGYDHMVNSFPDIAKEKLLAHAEEVKQLQEQFKERQNAEADDSIKEALVLPEAPSVPEVLQDDTLSLWADVKSFLKQTGVPTPEVGIDRIELDPVLSKAVANTCLVPDQLLAPTIEYFIKSGKGVAALYDEGAYREAFLLALDRDGAERFMLMERMPSGQMPNASWIRLMEINRRAHDEVIENMKAVRAALNAIESARE